MPEQLELLAFRCYPGGRRVRPRRGDRVGERARASVDGAAPPELGLAEATLALAVAEAGNVERAAVIAEQAHATVQAGQ